MRRYLAAALVVAIVAAIGGSTWANAQSGTTGGTGGTAPVATETPTSIPATPTETPAPLPPTLTATPVPPTPDPVIVMLNSIANEQLAQSQQFAAVSGVLDSFDERLANIEDLINVLPGMALDIDNIRSQVNILRNEVDASRSQINTLIAQVEALRAVAPPIDGWNEWFGAWDAWQLEQEAKTQTVLEQLTLFDERLAAWLSATPVPPAAAPTAASVPGAVVEICNQCPIGQ